MLRKEPFSSIQRLLNLVVRELSLEEDKVDVDFVVLILRWERVSKVKLVSCSDMAVPLLGFASLSCSSSSRCPYAERGRATWLADLAWFARVFGLGTDDLSAALCPMLLAKLLIGVGFARAEAGRGRLSYWRSALESPG